VLEHGVVQQLGDRLVLRRVEILRLREAGGLALGDHGPALRIEHHVVGLRQQAVLQLLERLVPLGAETIAVRFDREVVARAVGQIAQLQGHRVGRVLQQRLVDQRQRLLVVARLEAHVGLLEQPRHAAFALDLEVALHAPQFLFRRLLGAVDALAFRVPARLAGLGQHRLGLAAQRLVGLGVGRVAHRGHGPLEAVDRPAVVAEVHRRPAELQVVLHQSPFALEADAVLDDRIADHVAQRHAGAVAEHLVAAQQDVARLTVVVVELQRVGGLVAGVLEQAQLE
jgi:hypothetical protein